MDILFKGHTANKWWINVHQLTQTCLAPKFMICASHYTALPCLPALEVDKCLVQWGLSTDIYHSDDLILFCMEVIGITTGLNFSDTDSGNKCILGPALHLSLPLISTTAWWPLCCRAPFVSILHLCCSAAHLGSLQSHRSSWAWVQSNQQCQRVS